MDDFANNLRLLCSYYRSIAEVCRQLGLNRPQFNRYLADKARPSANSLRRICDFFGVEEYEILMPHEQFRRLIQVRPQSQRVVEREPQGWPESSHRTRLQGLNAEDVDRYLGYYFEYYLSMACPGMILRTLVCIERRGNGVYYQRTERLTEAGGPVCHGRYFGLVNFLTDRIFLSDYESITGNEMTQTILFPSFKNRISRLSGLRLGVSGSGERMPCCARVVYEYLGPTVRLRQALRLCGLYARDSEDIDPLLRRAITNQMDANDWHFRAIHL